MGSRNELTTVALGVALLTSCQTPGAFSQSLSDVDVALKYLKRHGVPCGSVASAAITVYINDIITCEDGRQWVLFWLEDEVAYVQPSHDLYKWRREMYAAYPKLYERARPLVQVALPAVLSEP